MLRVAEIDNVTGRILLTNEDNTITLRKNRSIEIMPGISIKTADSDELRYYIYKEVIEPGIYEIRGSVANGSYTWTAENFAGFYYDIDVNLGTEALTVELNDGNGSIGEPRGVTYTTTAQPKEFEYYNWGSYSAIGFLGNEYFAGYHESADDDAWSAPILYDVSEDEFSLADEQLVKILMDEYLNKIVKKGESIKLKEGYELVLKGISDEGRIYLNLLKDGELVDESFISPSVDSATMRDKTYYYCKDVGSQENVAIIAAHFRTTYKDEDYAMAIVDGIWQISETPLDVSEGTVYGKMTIQTVTSDSIVMDNEDNDITLERKSDIELMPGFHIRTADNETLRYYICRMVTVEQDSS
jgi:S-layer protein (TIGR01567 family)